MGPKLVSALLAATVVLAPVSAFAAHGQPGLWTVTASMTMPNPPSIPPEALAQMKARHIPVPGSGEPVTNQMCMTAAQVQQDVPPPMNTRDETCNSKLINQSPELIQAETTCHGRMEGSGHVEIHWRGNTHYESTYTFKGMMDGHPQEMTTRATGDFVKTDCGSVRPYPTPPGQ
jgi:hypothetical protein